MRNPSKNTIKRLMRPATRSQTSGFWLEVGYAHRWSNYRFWNECGAKVWEMTRGKVNNRTGAGATRYLTPQQRTSYAI